MSERQSAENAARVVCCLCHTRTATGYVIEKYGNGTFLSCDHTECTSRGEYHELADLLAPDAESDAGRFPSHLTFDGMAWPDPSDPNDVQWRLRYGQPSKADLLFAASVMQAYHALIAIPQTTRNRRVRSIREALDSSVTPPEEGHS